MDEVMRRVQHLGILIVDHDALGTQSASNDHLLMRYYSALQEADLADLQHTVDRFDSTIDSELDELLSGRTCYRMTWEDAVCRVHDILISRGYTPLDQP